MWVLLLVAADNGAALAVAHPDILERQEQEDK